VDANDRVRAAIDRELGLAARLFSVQDPASEVSRLNAHASAEPLRVSAEMASLLDLARRARERTGGAFDVAAGAGGALPPPLSLDARRRTVAKSRPDVACDLSALSSGWTADRLAAAIVALGHPDVLADVGGDVSARGRRPDGSAWRVAVGAPQPGKVGVVVELADAAAATAGGSRVVDPRRGRPVAHGLVSATVVDRDGAWAAALASALLVLGPDDGRAFAARERLAARLVLGQPTGAFADWSTPAFRRVSSAPAPAGGNPR
jgi:thiamine biosynthesis lipoprotein